MPDLKTWLLADVRKDASYSSLTGPRPEGPTYSSKHDVKCKCDKCKCDKRKQIGRDAGPINFARLKNRPWSISPAGSKSKSKRAI